jgi:hypothetical protein
MRSGVTGRGVCAVCGINLALSARRRKRGHDETMTTTERAARGAYTDISQVPWYRRSDVNNLFVLLGFFGCLPLSCWTCYNLLTGDVYLSYQDSDGMLVKWGVINKIFAVVFAVAWTLIFFVVLLNVVTAIMAVARHAAN